MQLQQSSTSSLASLLAEIPRSQLQSLIQTRLTPDEAQAALYAWQLWARPQQLPPPGEWVAWLVLAGRGFGKSRAGAEWVRWQVEHGGARRIALVGTTSADVRDVMVEGESGLLAISPPKFRPDYQPSKRRLTWPNGAIATTYSADKPDQLRGPQHDRAWLDELAAWRYPEAYDQVMFGLRLGSKPQACITTTPRPTQIIKQLTRDPTVVVTRGSTRDNAANLAPTFLTQVIAKYEGTRLGRQEIDGEVLDDNPGALWKRTQLDQFRVYPESETLRRSHPSGPWLPQLIRVVVAVDPAVSTNPDSDETGIVVAGLGVDRHVYVLEDASGTYAPAQWGEMVARMALRKRQGLPAECVVAEVNQGGDLVAANIRTYTRGVRLRTVHAKRGKALRAEPVSTLYEQGRVHHVGTLAKLEDQMCDWDPSAENVDSPDRVDALVYAVTELAQINREGRAR